MTELEFFTTKEVAAIMKVSPRTVYVLMNQHRNRLPNVRAGRLYRIPRMAFERWLENQS